MSDVMNMNGSAITLLLQSLTFMALKICIVVLQSKMREI